MKCEYVLKKMYSESISVRAKQEIDEHIAGCSYCQEQIESCEKVGELIRTQRLNTLAVPNRSALLQEIRRHHAKRHTGAVFQLEQPVVYWYVFSYLFQLLFWMTILRQLLMITKILNTICRNMRQLVKVTSSGRAHFHVHLSVSTILSRRLNIRIIIINFRSFKS